MNDKKKEVKRFQAVRGDYVKNVKSVKSWIQDTDKRLECGAGEPQVLSSNVKVCQILLCKSSSKFLIVLNYLELENLRRVLLMYLMIFKCSQDSFLYAFL